MACSGLRITPVETRQDRDDLVGQSEEDAIFCDLQLRVGVDFAQPVSVVLDRKPHIMQHIHIVVNKRFFTYPAWSRCVVFWVLRSSQSSFQRS